MRAERLLDTVEQLSRCNETPGKGVTRFSWSDADRKARMYLERELALLGITPRTDGIGNIRAVMRGTTNKPRILMGSHLDTVRHGGKLDGTYGVAAALEALRSFHETDGAPERDIEFIAFAEEEGSNFGCTCLGSKAVTGQITLENLCKLTDAGGQSAHEVLTAFGLAPENLPREQIEPASVAAYFEAHIEQNTQLELQGRRIGLATAISGMRLYAATLTGRPDHAASPMRGRRDPLAAFADAASNMRRLWRFGSLPEDFSCTVGRIVCQPNVGNAIPEEVVFTVDVRHVSAPVLEEGWRIIGAVLEETAADHGVSMTVRLLSESGGVRMADEALLALEKGALKHGVVPLRMISGPAHDAASMGRITSAGLLFVPSAQGLSHCPEEYSSPEDLVLGAEVLEEAVHSLAFRG